MKDKDLLEYLKAKANEYEVRDFIENDPIVIPHQFTLKEDIEIAGFLTAMIAWGNRKSIIKSAQNMMQIMGDSPYEFVVNFSSENIPNLPNSLHRTFLKEDFICVVECLQNCYQNHGGLEKLMGNCIQNDGMEKGLSEFKKLFFANHPSKRTFKHLPDPLSGSAAKRMVMYLRWMCRQSNENVDLGIWKSISPTLLHIPLDVHTGNIARKLQIISRKQNDWKTVEELQKIAIQVFPNDPSKLDFALFGIGVYKVLD
jgi:uncharacterized protein (TIGR02757 family)